MDRNDYYGGESTSLNLIQVISFVSYSGMRYLKFWIDFLFHSVVEEIQRRR